jgi:hypothetical protein
MITRRNKEMPVQQKGLIFDHFAELDDPLSRPQSRHNLLEVIIIAICAAI